MCVGEDPTILELRSKAALSRYRVGPFAKSLGRCCRTLERLFKRLRLPPPKKWLEAQQTERAQQELATTKELGVISEELGFRSVRAFSRFCVARLHTTPTAWRALFRSQVSTRVEYQVGNNNNPPSEEMRAQNAESEYGSP
jgi:AraC-like DNA-binding protein